MVERVSPQQFHERDGVKGWRVLFGGAMTYFVTGSFAKGVQLVDAIGKLADAANHHPDVDLRYGGVRVALVTHEIGELSERDVALAQQISAAARDLGIPADPSRAHVMQVSIDALSIPAIRPFWCAVMAYDERNEDDAVDPLCFGPVVTFQQMEDPRPQRNRIHIDVSVPRDQAEQRVTAALAAGGHMVNDTNAPYWWTLADAEGNEVDIAPWADDRG